MSTNLAEHFPCCLGGSFHRCGEVSGAALICVEKNSRAWIKKENKDMGVGTLRCVVINVTDLQLAYKFWGVVTGLEVIGSETGWHDWLGYLGTKDPWKHEIILQRVDTSPLEIQAPNPEKPNQVHIDITPNDGIDQAIEAIVELGGKVKKAPSLYPRPGSHGDHRPLIDWAVMQDPFGNEFCLVDELTLEQSHAAMEAVDATTDHEWRTAAGVTGQART